MSDNVLGFPHGRRPGDYLPCDVEPPFEEPPCEGNGQPLYTPATKILAKASGLIDGERQEQHGDRELCHTQIARLWTAYLGVKVSAVDVACMMALLKIARTQTGSPNKDCWIDACGYLSIAGELSEKVR